MALLYVVQSSWEAAVMKEGKIYIVLKGACDVCHCVTGRKKGGSGRSAWWLCVMQGLYLLLIGPELGSNREKVMQNGLETLFLSPAFGAGNSVLREYLC